MAQRTHGSAESLSQYTSTLLDTWQNKVSTTITPGVSKTVLIGWSAEISVDDTIWTVSARLTIDGASVSSGSFRPKEDTAPIDWNPISGFAFIAASGSPSTHTVEIDLLTVDTSGTDRFGSIRNARIWWLELGANDYFDEVTSRQTRTGSTTLANVSGLSITPASGNYVVLASCEVDTTSTTDGCQSAITSSGSPSTQPYVVSNRPNYSLATYGMYWAVAHAWNRTSSGGGDGALSGSESLSIGFAPNSSGQTMGLQNARIVALNVADFDNVYVSTLASDSTGTETTYTDAHTLNVPTPAANDHLALAVWSHEGSSTSISTYTQFLDDGDSLNERIREAYITTDDRGDSTGLSGRIETWAASSRDLKIQRKSENSTPNAKVKRGAVIVAFDLGSAGAGSQNVTANGIASTAAIGSPTVTRGAVALTANSIDPTVALGSPTVSNVAPAQDLTVNSIDPTAAFGTPALTVGAVTVTANAIAPTAAFGTATLTTGAVSVSANSIASTAAFGSPTLALNVTPSGIASTAAFGSPTLSVGATTVTADGIAPTAAFGSPTVSTASAVVSPNSIDPTAAFGTAAVTPGAVTVSPNGIASTAVLGSPSVGLAIVVDGLPTTVAFGSPSLTTVVGVQPDGIGPTVQFGVPALVFSQSVDVGGIGPTVAFGTFAIRNVWEFLPPTAETWTAQPATAETWVTQGATTETWATQSPTVEAWTVQTPTPESWS